MFSFNNIYTKKRILEIGKNFQFKKYHRNMYLYECLKILFNDIKREYGANFIYADFFMIEKNEFYSLSEINPELLKSFFNEQQIKVVDFSKQLIKDRKVRSFVKLMNEKIKNGIVLYENKSFDASIFSQRTDSYCFNLNNISNNNIVSKSIDNLENVYKELFESKVNEKEFDKFLNHLGVEQDKRRSYRKAILMQKIYPLFVPNLNAYFIRPQIANKNFNGVFYLQLTRPLLESHYNQISEVITQIFCEIALWTKERRVKLSVYNEIADDYSHSLKHEFDAVLTKLDDLGLDTSEIQKKQNIEEIKTYIKRLIAVNDFRLFMQRASTMDDFFLQKDPKLINYDNSISISLKKVLMDALQTCIDSISFFGLVPIHQILVKSEILKLKTKVMNQFVSDYMYVNEKGLYIVCLELLKNAIENSNSEKPFIDLLWEIDSSGQYSLKFINNSEISDNDLRAINEKDFYHVTLTRTKIGVRTIWQILSFRHFNKFRIKWGFEVQKVNYQGHKCTSFELRIPYNDIVKS